MHSKNIERALAALTLCSLCLVATSSALAQKGKGTAERHMLWKVESGKSTLYLLGSVHALTPEMYPLAPVIEQAIADADAYAFETSLDSIDQGTVLNLMLTKGSMGGDTTLRTMLPTGLYDSVAARLADGGMNIAMFEKFRPWSVAIILMGLQLQGSELRTEYGIDNYVNRKARETGKPTAQLETAEFQLNLFADMTQAAQEVLLRQALDDVDSSDESLSKIMKAWKSGDVVALESIMLESFAQEDGFYRKALVERNANWIPQIEAFLKGEKHYLVTVGAMHMVGKDGVVQMLKDKGYQVTQL